jgi:hypothetical protein
MDDPLYLDQSDIITSDTTTVEPEDVTEGGVTDAGVTVAGVTEFPGHVTVSEKAEEALSVADRELTTQEPTTPKEEVKGKIFRITVGVINLLK